MDLVRLVFRGQKLSSDTLGIRDSLLVDAVAELGCEAWRHIKNVLMQLFLNDPVCKGRLQTL
jgi:hypothetical protein